MDKETEELAEWYVNAEPTMIYVSPEVYEELLAELEKPPKVNEKLRATLQRAAERKEDADANALGTHPETS